jgi:hypothetical protein
VADQQLDLFVDAPRHEVAVVPPVAWPSSGITGPGSWGSHDGFSWQKVDLLIVGGQRGFKMGYIVESPERAREAMREAVLSVTVRR